MKLAYTILYVNDVPATMAFYEKAFGLKRRFLHESNDYGEMDTGETRLAFASIRLGKTHGPEFKDLATPKSVPPFEVAFVSPNVEEDYRRAVAAGATELQKPVLKPWGQTVAYVRDLNGFVVEICTLDTSC